MLLLPKKLFFIIQRNIFSITLDGKDKKQDIEIPTNTGNLYWFTIYEDILYYYETRVDEVSLCGTSLSGGQATELLLPQEIGQPVHINDGWIYCVNLSENGSNIIRHFSRIRQDGSQKQLLDEGVYDHIMTPD